MKYFFYIVLTLCAIGCVHTDDLETITGEDAPLIKVDLRINTPNIQDTRTLVDNEFKNINIYLADRDGNVVLQRYYEDFSGTTLTFPGVVGEYQIFAIANIGPVIIIVENLSQFESYGPSFKEDVTMYAQSDFIEFKKSTSTGEVVEIEPLYFTRYMAKVTVFFDFSKLDCETTITPTKIALRRVPSHCYVIGPNDPTIVGIDTEGESITDNLTPSNHYTATPLYLYENQQGTGTYYYEKIPPIGKEYCCTYLEITTLHTRNNCTQTVIYKHYIGNNTYNNFDVNRNTWYCYYISFIDDGGICDDLWSVEIVN